MSMAATSPWLAVAAGMLTVGAPCVLPMLPVVLGASVAGGPAQRTRPLFIALGFALSFAAVALLFSSFTQVLGVSPEGLRRFAAAMLLVFGVLTVWPKPFQWLSQQASGVLSRVASLGLGSSAGNWGGLLLGLSLGAVWTPCAGPVLASILTLIATEPPGGQHGGAAARVFHRRRSCPCWPLPTAARRRPAMCAASRAMHTACSRFLGW